MRTTLSLLLVAGLMCILLAPPVLGQQKLAQAGMKFLNVGADPRGAAMGDALTGVEGASTAMFYNPAGMARIAGFTSISLSQTQWIADIKHNYASIALSPSDGEYGVIGASVHMVDYGTFQGTVRANNDKGFYDESDIPGLNFKPKALMIGVSYARALSEKFSVGGTVKYVRQSLGSAINTVQLNSSGAVSGYGALTENTTSLYAFDFGILYRTGFKSLNFGMTVRNFSKEARFQKEGFQLPLTFKIGMSMNMLDLFSEVRETHTFLLTVDAEHPRDYYEQIRFGGEYVYMRTLALRIGWTSPASEYNVSYGIGVRPLVDVDLSVDYAYTPFGIFDSVHRLGFQFAL